MTDNTAKRWFSMLIVLIPIGVIIYALFSQSETIAKPKVEKGEIDLRNWKFYENGAVPLNGDWNFYWRQLFAGPTTERPAYMKVPGIWNGHVIDNEKLSAEGFATYTVKVHLPPGKHLYAVNILTMSNAYAMWINNDLVAVNGHVGEDERTSVPQYAPCVVPFEADTSELSITVQISNFDHCKGGFWLPVEFGSPEHVFADRDNRVLLEMFLFGCLFMMALYHFGLYVLRRKDSTTLFFGLMCAVISIRSLFTGEILINHIMPDLGWHLARRIEYILTFLSVPIYVTFCRKLYPTEWNKTLYRVIIGFGALLCAVVLLTPTTIFTSTSYIFTGYAWIVSMLTIWIFVKAFRKKLEEAGIFLATTLFFLLTIVNDTLNQLELVHTGLYLSFGLLVVTFAQSFSLSSRFANAFFNSEMYAGTFRKFVPSQFLKRIAKDGIHSIKPGNAEREQVTVLFSDIRSFTTIAETMSPDEVFKMLNTYLSRVEPPVSRNNGFVDKYMGDGIMALFENSSDKRCAQHAITAALEMQEALKTFNAERAVDGKVKLETGIGLHTGQVIIGTLGANDRMDSTAIGDAVNLTSRIEGMTKMYGAPILTSIDTIRTLEDASLFRTRFIDNVTAKGKNEPVQIWQIISRGTDTLSKDYIDMLQAYNDGIELYRKKEIVRAKQQFVRALELFPSDKVSAIYLERCEKFLASGDEAYISDVSKLEEK